MTELTLSELKQEYWAICPNCEERMEASYPVTYCKECLWMGLTRLLNFEVKKDENE